MPAIKGSHASLETRLKLSAARKGNHNAAGNVPWNKGISMSEDARKNMSVAHLGHKLPQKTRDAMCVAHIGHAKTPGMTGLKHSMCTIQKLKDTWHANADARLAKLLLIAGNGKKYLRGKYASHKSGDVYYRSSYELRMYKILDADDAVSHYEVEAYMIEYNYDGENHYYVPDIYVTYCDGSCKHIEIKPSNLICDKINVAKFAAARKVLGDKFCIVTEKELTMYENKG